MNTYNNPYRVLLEIYEVRGEYGKSLDLLKELQNQFPNDPGLRAQIDRVEDQIKTKYGVDTPATGAPGG
jgi:hypothetical protein